MHEESGQVDGFGGDNIEIMAEILNSVLELPGQVQASAVCCTDHRARACNGLSVARINGVPS